MKGFSPAIMLYRSVENIAKSNIVLFEDYITRKCAVADGLAVEFPIKEFDASVIDV